MRLAALGLALLLCLAGASQDKKPSPFSRKKPPPPSSEPPKDDASDLKRKFSHAVGLELKLGVEADLSKERLTEMAHHFAGFSDDLWFATEGNFYIQSIAATDKSKAGNVRVFATEVEKEFTRGGGMVHGRGTPGAYMEVAGRCSVFTFVHEGGHLFFHLPDEYLNKQGGGGCPECVMVGGNMKGFGPGKWKFCTKQTHTDKGEACWDRIRKLYPNVKFPHPGFPPEPPFTTDVVVNNTGN